MRAVCYAKKKNIEIKNDVMGKSEFLCVVRLNC